MTYPPRKQKQPIWLTGLLFAILQPLILPIKPLSQQSAKALAIAPFLTKHLLTRLNKLHGPMLYKLHYASYRSRQKGDRQSEEKSPEVLTGHVDKSQEKIKIYSGYCAK